VHTFNFLTRELAVSVAKDTSAVPRSWISSLISLSDDGQTLYVNVGIEKAVSGGGVVHWGQNIK
jgi:hypothetical protein